MGFNFALLWLVSLKMMKSLTGIITRWVTSQWCSRNQSRGGFFHVFKQLNNSISYKIGSVTRYTERTLQHEGKMLCRLWLERNKVKVYKNASEMEKLFYLLKNVNWQVSKQVNTWKIQHKQNNAAFHKIHSWATEPLDTGYSACWNLYEFRKGLDKLIWKIALGLLHLCRKWWNHRWESIHVFLHLCSWFFVGCCQRWIFDLVQCCFSCVPTGLKAKLVLFQVLLKPTLRLPLKPADYQWGSYIALRHRKYVVSFTM